MELNREEIDKILWELHRIGNAVEIIAMSSDAAFVPLDEALRIHHRQRNSRRGAQTTTRKGPPEAGSL